MARGAGWFLGLLGASADEVVWLANRSARGRGTTGGFPAGILEQALHRGSNSVKLTVNALDMTTREGLEAGLTEPGSSPAVAGVAKLLDKCDIIKEICAAIGGGDFDRARMAALKYDGQLVAKSPRRCSVKEAMQVYVDDGFIDRYSGARLVNPAVLRVLSSRIPDVFPFQKNWKMSETHLAYWQLVPTIDHRIPVSRGGRDERSNWVTTSMLRNSAKSNWLLGELGWHEFAAGRYQDWDGLSGWLIAHVEATGVDNHEAYVRGWYAAAKAVLKAAETPAS